MRLGIGLSLRFGAMGWRRGSIAALLLAIGALAVAGAATAAARDTYVDCRASTSTGAGTKADPVASLQDLGKARLGPGDRLLLRRGTSCQGTLRVRGAGTAGDPALVGGWGQGKKPQVAATGASGIELRNMSHVVLRGLAVTNPGDNTTKKRGVHVVVRSGVSSDVVVRNLNVHDVGGNLDKDAGGSGGIQADVLPNADAPGPVRFDGLRIVKNRINDVSRSGIFIVGTNDPDRPRATKVWPEASSGVVVRSNRVSHTAGDGIVPVGTEGALVTKNIVSDGNLAGRPLTDPAGMICNAGIWTFHANNTVIRNNEVFGMHLNGCDGTGYDIDYDQDGTVVEYNLSHDNEGGFMLLCTDDSPRVAEVRFNLSINDGHTFAESPCAATPGRTLDGIRMYNNTFYAPHADVFTPGLTTISKLFGPGDFRFANNIVVATETQPAKLPCGDFCDHNLFYGLPPSGTSAVTAKPVFVDPTLALPGRYAAGKGFRLKDRSPAIGAGIAIPDDGGRDYFGDPITGPPSLGMDQPG